MKCDVGMGRNKHITAEQRREICRLREQDMTLSAISKRLNISINACHRALEHVKRYGDTSNKSRVPRCRKTTDGMIHRLSEKDRFRTAVDIHAEISTQENLNISVHTIRRRLTEFGLRGRIARKKPLISKKNRNARLSFAKEHINWTREQWAKVIFTDESKFNRFGSDGTTYVRRRVGEEFKEKCLKPTVKGGGGSVMVWAGISLIGHGPICRINGIIYRHVYVDILEKNLLPYAAEHFQDWILQADNDPKHTSKKAKEFLKDHNINVMTWPAQSPDLNPIETLWNDVKKVIKEKKPSNLNKMYEIIQEGWRNISSDRCARLIDSMPRRCQEVIRNKGGPTKY